MARKPEDKFIDRIHKKLPSDIYRLKNNNAFVGGIPDYWYSADKGDLWVEYKYVPELPCKVPLDPLAYLTSLQSKWLNDRLKEGRSVACIIGSPSGGVILTNGSWNSLVPTARFTLKPDMLADWIICSVSSQNSSKLSP